MLEFVLVGVRPSALSSPSFLAMAMSVMPWVAASDIPKLMNWAW
jgi:hypothetical protein